MLTIVTFCDYKNITNMPLMGLGASDINGLCGLYSPMTLLVTMLKCRMQSALYFFATLKHSPAVSISVDKMFHEMSALRAIESFI